jgi:hypothetical protein
MNRQQYPHATQEQAEHEQYEFGYGFHRSLQLSKSVASVQAADNYAHHLRLCSLSALLPTLTMGRDTPNHMNIPTRPLAATAVTEFACVQAKTVGEVIGRAGAVCLPALSPLALHGIIRIRNGKWEAQNRG